MKRIASHLLETSLVAVLPLLAACADNPPMEPAVPPAALQMEPAIAAQASRIPAFDALRAIVTIMASTARYHDLNAAIADGFVLLHPCEVRPGEGPVGIVYVNMDRLLDGRIDPAKVDALVYEPARLSSGRPKLVAAEFAVPFALWTQPEPPTFLGQTFQREDEFGVFALHVWVWRHNPEGLFAETNPRVSCGA
jgi:hypothetical protein